MPKANQQSASATNANRIRTAKQKGGCLQGMVGLRPCDCDSMADLCSMDSTHKCVGKYDMLLQHDQAVILTEQPTGEKCRAQIVIPKRIFRQLLEWYETEQPNY